MFPSWIHGVYVRISQISANQAEAEGINFKGETNKATVLD